MQFQIKKRNGEVFDCFIDNYDYYNWDKGALFVQRCGGGIYRICYAENHRTKQLSRFLMDFPEGLVVDHKNGNSLDNRRCNLRICTASQNQYNRKPNKNNKYYNMFFHLISP